MKQKLTNIVRNEVKNLNPEWIRQKEAILIKLRPDGSVDQCYLSESFSAASHGKQGPGIAYVVTLNQLQEELDGDYAGNPGRRFFVENKDRPIFEAKAFGDHRRHIVIFAYPEEESQNA